MLRHREVVQIVDEPSYLDSLPDELTGLVLLHAFPRFNKDIYQCLVVFCLRPSSKTVRRVIDVHLLGVASNLNSRIVRRISEEAFALFTGMKKLRLCGRLGRHVGNSMQKMTRLRELTLHDCSAVTDDSLSRLTQLLTSLHIYRDEYDDAFAFTGSFLSSLTNLTTLAIPEDTQITPDRFACLTGLTSLNIESCELIMPEDLAPFRQSLRIINIMGSDIELLDLVSMPKLECVYIDMRSDNESEDILRDRGVDVVHGCIRGSFLR